jgi:hypothetical protein
MSRRNIVVWSLISALVLGVIAVSVTVYIVQIQQGAANAAAAERGQFNLTMTADAR